MKHFFSLVIVFAAVAFGGCSKYFDYHISKSVFIEDEKSPGLPIYSERGYNSFGVYWNLAPFTSTENEQAKILVQNDSCHIIFFGTKRQSASSELKISFPGYTPETFLELLSLKGKKIDLTDEECSIFLPGYQSSGKINVIEGEVHIKQAQQLFVDKQLLRVVLSGTFTCKGTRDKQPITLADSRFDMGFGEDNFFYLQQ